MSLLTVALSVLALQVGYCELTGSQAQRAEGVKNSGEILTNLYITIRNLAFPQSPLTTESVSNRFVLLYPGVVLNYWDYFPGTDYEESLLRQNLSIPEANVPPAVMEKWFDIADVMVGADPFSGGVSGKSMATSYETILSQIQLLGMDRKTNEAQTKYKTAISYLSQVVADPDNLTMNATKLSLYERYQMQYADSKLDMEEKIQDKRQTTSAIDYELWFQRNYASLYAKVENAYTKWLSFGEKNLVETYMAYLDSTSSGVEVEKARTSLRASGVTSLDRTRTVYPVSFVPSNWYKYLLPSETGPSRDMLIAKESMIKGERDALKTIIKINNMEDSSGMLDRFEERLNESASLSSNKTATARKLALSCLQSNSESNSTTNISGVCSQYRSAQDEAVNAAFQQAQVNSDYESAQFMANSENQFNDFLAERIESLEGELAQIAAELNSSREVYLGGIADSAEFRNLNSVLNETEQAIDDNWMQFEYNSDSSHLNTTQDTTSINVAVSIGVTEPAIPISAQGSFGRDTTDLYQALNSASVKVSGSLLRVVIKRPWFKPSIFEDPSLSFVQRDESQQKNTYVSPGPLTEKELKQAIGGGRNNLYLLPEYVTSFLLARNVKLQFSGLDTSSVSHAMQSMVSTSFSASYKIFSMSAAAGHKKTKQSVNAYRTANGMIISIPGAQIIGYYTEVVPKFPNSQ